jgi:hypothetical protein
LAEVSCACGKTAENGGMKTVPKTRPDNVTSFILEGRWPLALGASFYIVEGDKKLRIYIHDISREGDEYVISASLK